MSEEVVQADSTAEFKALVHLEEVEVDSGEKDENEIYKKNCKLYRFAQDKDPQEWVTRGTGKVRLLQHKQSNQIRIILREEKTGRVRMNHFVHPNSNLTPKQGQEDVCFQWTAKDYAEETPWEGIFAIKFNKNEEALDFKKAYDNARTQNRAAIRSGGGGGGGGGGDVSGPSISTEAHAPSSPAVKKEILRAGITGPGNKPKKGQLVHVHCVGYQASTMRAFWTTEGQKPYDFVVGVGQVVPGWDEACLDMAKGEKARVFVPSQKAYGPAGYGAFGIPPNCDLVFEIEMLGFEGGEGVVHTSPPATEKDTGSVGTKSGKPGKDKEKSGSSGGSSSSGSAKSNSSSSPSTGESQWRKLNNMFRSHMDKDSKSPTTVAADWSTAMSEYLFFAHKLRGDSTAPPTKVKRAAKPLFKSLNVAFHKWVMQQKEADLEKDWSPPIRDYIKHAQKLASSSGSH